MKPQHRVALRGCRGSLLGFLVGASVGGYIGYSMGSHVKPIQPIEAITGILWLITLLIPYVGALVGIVTCGFLGSVLGGSIGAYRSARELEVQREKPQGTDPEV